MMESPLDFATARALLEWHVEMGADEAICEAPIDRYAAEPPPAPAPQDRPAPVAVAPAAAPVLAGADPVEEARQSAGAAGSLDALRAAMAAYPHCDLARGARNLVFADGNPAARVMVIGEAPGRDEDLQGKPFVGRAGQLLDRMFAAIGMDRASADRQAAVYITNIVPWRPPQNRDPDAAEIAMMMPFVARHVDLVQPDVLVLMGNISCLALLGRKGITRMRGNWAEALGRPALPMFHPAYLLRTPHAKREAWADLLALQARLRDG